VVLVFRLSGQGLAVAGVVAAEVLPVLALGSIAGVIVDRFSRKWVLIGADLCRAGLALSLVWPQGVWHAYAVAAGLAAAGSFFNPALQATIPLVTTEPQRLAANSVAWSTGRLVQILAAAVGGGIIALLGTGPSFALNAATFAASAVLLARLRLPDHGVPRPPQVQGPFSSYAEDVRQGLEFVASRPFLRRLLAVQTLASLATGGTSAMLVVLAQRQYGLPAAGFAWFIAAIGLGALLGPLIPNLFVADYRTGRWLYGPYVIRGIGDALLALTQVVPVGLALLFVYGLNTSTGTVVFSSTLQTWVPDRMRGRVFTMFDMTWGACRLISLAIGGIVVDAFGVQLLYWASGVLLVLAGAVGLAGRPSLENYPKNGPSVSQ